VTSKLPTQSSLLTERKEVEPGNFLAIFDKFYLKRSTSRAWAQMIWRILPYLTVNLAGLSEAQWKLAPDRFQLLRPNLEGNQSLKSGIWT
jgi:hypothetical protein